MRNSKFIESLKVKNVGKKEESETEKKAKRIIRDFDRTLQHKIYKNTRDRYKDICRITENKYNNRTVVQASFLTIGCQMKKAGSCWNCNYGALGESLITPNQYVKAFKRGLGETKRRCFGSRGIGKYNRS